MQPGSCELNGLFIRYIGYAVTHVDDETRILPCPLISSSRLGDIIEPDFGLLDELLRLGVLTRSQCADVRIERTAYRRNYVLLNHLTSSVDNDRFLEALQRTGQQHVVNFITQNGGEKLKSTRNRSYMNNDVMPREQ